MACVAFVAFPHYKIIYRSSDHLDYKLVGRSCVAS
jgi:hypothetical protein